MWFFVGYKNSFDVLFYNDKTLINLAIHYLTK